ncbi:hypothetical protein BXZ70DRAFT_1008110 [Cristinia sonorae]|uniref:Uncharacterized protein n=1 Tax=Cristinia sonorae TaxID=1940300 RepID=A0A8K0XQ06_9AGAR|nr:hypothetical protein BXZ70DRAFT_1008110 [Cristinia sonorae]
MIDIPKLLTGESAVQAILADIPLFAAGILALGMLTFLLIKQRANWMAVFLHCSVFAAFIAGILDLSQVLLRFGPNAHPELRWSTITGLIISREVFLALSVGLRSGFFWFFVTAPLTDDTPNGMHLATWEKWGIVGMLMKWTLALLCVSVALLQILYRTVDAFLKFGPIYEVESTIEIVLSACFVLKLILNTYLVVVSATPGVWRWRPCMAYIPMFFALCINASMGAGNMILFLWSETILGRLLQAIEYYIAVVTVAAWVFSSEPGSPATARPRRMPRTSSFHGLAPMSQASFRLSRSPFVDSSEKQRTHSQRGSIADRLSQFLVPRAMAQRGASPYSPTADKLWNQNEAERGRSPSLYSPNADLTTNRGSYTESAYEPKESAKWQDPLFSNVLSSATPTREEMLANAALQPTSLTVPFPARTFSPTVGRTDSPIYGLGGRQVPQPVERSLLSEPPRQPSPTSRASSTYSQILLQQAELDKSIATLKLLARDTVDTVPSSSASQSEFSLSNFPAPPWRNSTDTDYTVRAGKNPVVMISRADSIKSQIPLVNTDLVPPTMPAAIEHSRKLSVPFSENEDPLPTGRMRVDSEGTQYEITSFIGHLTHKKGESTATAATFSSGGGSPPRSRTLSESSAEGVSTAQFPLPPRARPGLPSRPRLAVGTNSLETLEENALSPQDEFENPRRAPPPS